MVVEYVREHSLHYGGQKAEKETAYLSWLSPFSFSLFLGPCLLDVNTYIQDRS